MILLSVSTAEQGCSLALSMDEQLICEEFWTSTQTHSRRLIDMISRMLSRRAGIAIKDIDGFVVARGPGSFTGVRIGISVVQGLSYALSKPVAGISSLDGIAWQFSGSSCQVCAMMDARRSQVYTARYQFERGRLIARSQESALSPGAAIKAAGNHAIFAGSGALAYRDLIFENFQKDVIIAPDYQCHVRAAALIQAAGQQPELFESYGKIPAPVYLRKSDAELQNHN